MATIQERLSKMRQAATGQQIGSESSDIQQRLSAMRQDAQQTTRTSQTATGTNPLMDLAMESVRYSDPLTEMAREEAKRASGITRVAPGTPGGGGRGGYGSSDAQLAELNRLRNERNDLDVFSYASAGSPEAMSVWKQQQQINSRISELEKQLEAAGIDPKTGDINVPDAIHSTFWKGVSDVAYGGASTLDFVNRLGHYALGWTPAEYDAQNTWTSRLAEEQKRNSEYWGNRGAGAVQNDPAAVTAVNLGATVIAAVPSAIEAMMSGGASLATNTAGLVSASNTAGITSKIGQLGNTLYTLVDDAIKNPLYWSSFWNVLGRGYENAKANGASDANAVAYALANGGINALIEIGGGIEKPRTDLGWRDLAEGAFEEGTEEYAQRKFEKGLEGMYGKWNPLYSTEDPNAIFNPKEDLTEFAGGAIAGGVLGAGQAAVNTVVNAGRGTSSRGEIPTAPAQITQTEQTVAPQAEAQTARQAEPAQQPITQKLLRSIAEDPEQLAALGIDTKGKSNSQIREEIRAALESQRADAVRAQETEAAARANMERPTEYGWYGEPSSEPVAAPNWYNQRNEVESAAEGTSTPKPSAPWYGTPPSSSYGNSDSSYGNSEWYAAAPAAQTETLLPEEIRTGAVIEYANANEKSGEISPTMADTMRTFYSPAQDPTAYMRGMTATYNAGTKGAPIESVNAPGITFEQKQAAYIAGQAAATVKARSAAQPQSAPAQQTVQQPSAQETPAQTQKKPAVRVENPGLDMADANTAKAKLTRRESRALDALGKVIGKKIQFVETITAAVTDEDGNVRHSGANAEIDGDTIRIALDSDDPFLVAAVHEVVHGIRDLDEASYQTLAKFVANNMTDDYRKVAEWEEARKGYNPEQIPEEIVCDAFGRMLGDEAKLRQFVQDDRNAAQKLFDALHDLLVKVQRALSGGGQKLTDNQRAVYSELEGRIETMLSLFEEALNNVSGVEGDVQNAEDAIGVHVDEKTESANPQSYSLKSFRESDYVTDRDNAAKDLSSRLGISVQKAKRYIDSVNSVAKMIADDRVRLDYESSPGRSSFVGNSEYGGSVDFSTVCKKRRLYTGTIDAIQNAMPDKALTADEMLKIRAEMKKRGYEVSCGLCYVEGSRVNIGKYTQEFLDELKQGEGYVPTMAEMNTSEGQEKLRAEHPEVYDQYVKFMNKLAQRKPKLFQMATEYQGEILKKFKNDSTVEQKNRNGGLRLQSFSDFEIIHLIDCMQVIMDMSRVGLAGQAYTKVPDFAWALGDTGLKINLSMIAKGVDPQGHIIYDEVEGMKHADAKALRDRYSKNVGTILVVFNDAQLKAALNDSFVDFIIPFHRSQWNKGQYEMLGLPAGATDYTMQQNESYLDGRKNANGKTIRPDNFMPNEYWDFSKSGKENAVEYLRMCAENGRRPKFYKLLVDNGDGSFSLQPDGSTDGYWKLLTDFKMYDNKGKGSPQMPVRPDFNMDEAERMLNSYQGGHQKFPVAQDVVDDFVKQARGKRYSLKQRDTDYAAAVERGDMETAQRMVDDAAKAAGYTVKAWHQTARDFTVFNTNNPSAALNDSETPNGIFFKTNDHDIGLEGKKQMSMFIDPGKTLDFKDRKAANAWYRENVDGYDALSKKMGAALKPIDDEMQRIEAKMFQADTTEEEYQRLDKEWNKLLEKMHVEEDKYRGQLRDLLNDYFLGKDRPYDSIHLGYDGHRYVDGKRENVETYIVFSNTQAKSADPVTYDNNGNVIPLSERFNPENEDIRYSRSGRDVLDEYVEQYGEIKRGEKPARDFSMPKRTTDKTKVSMTARTVAEAGATPESFVPTIENLAANHEFDYTPYSDEAAISNAAQIAARKGWSKTLTDWSNEVSNGGVSKTNTAVGWALYNNAVNSGDTETALNVLNLIVKHQRNAAQAVQATRILKQLNPETQLYSAEQTVVDINEELKKRLGKKAPEVEIDPDLAEQFLRAKNQDDRDKIMTKIFRDIGRQMPTTFLDRWTAWRYTAMLGNVRTIGRNTFGNLGFAPVVLAKDLTATALEGIVSKATGGKIERTKGNVIGRGDLLSAAWDDYANMQEAAMGQSKYSDRQAANREIEDARRIFGNTKSKVWNKTGGAALEWWRVKTGQAMDVTDFIFNKPQYVLAMAQYCAANGISAEQIRSGKGLEKARAYAVKEAQKATYRDTNDFSQMVSSLGKSWLHSENAWKRGIATLGEGVLPFRKTPANILARGVEYSPIGLIKSLTYDAVQVKNGNMSAADMIDDISAGLTGTGLLALGVYLAAQGLLRGRGRGDDKKKEFADLEGHQDYALEIGGTSYTLDWLAPEALPLFIGANLWEAAADRKDGMQMKDILTAISNVSEPMLQMSMLQSLNDLLDGNAYGNEETSALMRKLSSAATSYLTQAFPTLLGQVERTGEGKRMTTYTDKNGFLTGDMQYILGKISAKIPGWDFQQIPYIDAWGREELTGKFLERAGQNFVNPSFVSKVNESDMEKELERVYDATGENVFPQRAAKYINVDGERKDLSAKEYVTYATEKGRTSYTVVGGMVGSDLYKGLSDAEKADCVKDAYSYANQTARAAVGGKISDSWVVKAQNGISRGIQPETFIMLRSMTGDIESLKDKDGKTIDNSKGLQTMEAIYAVPGLTNDQRQYLFECFGVGKTIIGYNKALVDQKLKEMKQK